MSGADLTRRQFLRQAGGLALTAAAAGTGAAAFIAGKAQAEPTLWQIDPTKCIGCGNCATYCVLGESAVKCVHVFGVCGYCELCFGYFDPRSAELDASAENCLCPTDALHRAHVDGPYYEYIVDEPRCIACGKCVKGCTTFGNGSLMLQVRHDRCANCNQCAIAAACPTQAFRRVPRSGPSLRRLKHPEARS